MMSAVASTVTVVTAPAPAEPSGAIGITVSAFTSVSADPPIVLVCIDKVASSLDAFLAAPGYTVNFLPEGLGDLAMIFATHGADRFGSVGWRSPEVGVGGPVLDSSYGHFECRVTDRVEVGDHWVIYGQVEAGGREDRNADPLLYLKRGFARASRY